MQTMLEMDIAMMQTTMKAVNLMMGIAVDPMFVLNSVMNVNAYTMVLYLVRNDFHNFQGIDNTLYYIEK